MRPTTIDIANEANVSLATVDRVINDRAGVSAATRARVKTAISELGYVRDLSAANLAKKRQYKLAFVIPDEQSQFISALTNIIKSAAERGVSDRSDIQLVQFTANNPHALVSALKTLQRKNFDGVAIMAPETPHVRDAISELKQSRIAVVALVADQPHSECDHFVGINNIAAGRTAAVLLGRMLPEKPGKIIVLSSSMQSRDSLDRRLGFDEIMTDRFSQLEVLPTLEGHGNPKRTTQSLHNALSNSSDVVGVYSLSSGNRVLTEFLSQLNPPRKLFVIVHELTSHTRNALLNESIDAVITQNTGHIVRSALRVLKAKSDQLEIDSSQEQIRIEIVLKENLP